MTDPSGQLLLYFGLISFAIFIWLGVRIINRRERWAKRTAVTLTVLLSLYVLSFGPACWWFSDWSSGYYHRMPPSIYWPIGRAARYGPWPIRRAICWYAQLGNSESLLLPAEWGGHLTCYVP